MATSRFSPLAGAAFLALTALLAACGGGGGGGGTPGGGGGGGVPPTNPPPTATPTPTATPFSTGQMTTGAGPLANATVAFTCGCTQQAGQVSADANGAYNIAVPAAMFGGGAGSYTPPGHNLMVIGYAPGGSHVQSWTMEFYANAPANDQNLDGAAGSNVSDKYTTATALYVYYQTIQYYAAHPPANNDNTYDVWNFNDIKALKAHFVTAPTQADTNLLNGITSAQASNTSLYPAVPSWDHTSGDTQNNTIVNLIKAMITADGATLPQPCGASCTGTPSP